MRLGVHRDQLAHAFAPADLALFYSPPDLPWDLLTSTASLGGRRRVFREIDAIVDCIAEISHPGDHILIMSNGGFGGIHQKVLKALSPTTLYDLLT
jgi:UDP-N-acetylmuramate: L-alanyl-gamma-D-glutamyl-meso-diaminopimelate ligase